MAIVEKRKNGIAFRVEETFEHKGYLIPESELFQIAESINFTRFVKKMLANEWLWRKQHNTPTHNKTS